MYVKYPVQGLSIICITQTSFVCLRSICGLMRESFSFEARDNACSYRNLFHADIKVAVLYVAYSFSVTHCRCHVRNCERKSEIIRMHIRTKEFRLPAAHFVRRTLRKYASRFLANVWQRWGPSFSADNCRNGLRN